LARSTSALSKSSKAHVRKPNVKRHAGLGSVGVFELPTRPLSEYTLAEYGCALQETASGSMRRAADLTRAAITESGFIGGVLDTITAGTLGLPRTFIGDDRIVKALEGDDLRDSEYDLLFPRSEARCVMAWGITLGVGLGQFVTDESRRLTPPQQTQPLLAQEQDDGSFLVPPAPLPMQDVGRNATPSLVSWDPRWLRCQWAPTGSTWHLLTAQGEIQIEPGDGEWLLFTPYRKRAPWDMAAWKSLILAFIMMRDGIFDRSRHAEMLAPVRAGVCPLGSSEPQRADFARQIREMQRFPWFTLPPGFDYKIIESTGKVADIYKAMIDAAEADVMVKLTGNKVMVEGSAGFSKSDFQARVSASLRQFYAHAWSDCARTQGLNWWTLENYGPAFAPPRVDYNTDPPEDQDAEIARYGTLGDALNKLRDGFGGFGYDIDPETVLAIAQRNKIKLRQKPAGTAPVTKLELAPTDIAKVVRVDEARASQGLPAIGDERGAKTISELEASTTAADPPPPATPTVPA